MATPRLDIDATALLVVDMQKRLVEHIDQHEALVAQISRLIRGADALGLPILVTEQYPKGLGPTIEPVMSLLGGAVGIYDKLKFSACIEAVRDVLERRGVRSVLVAGIEAHVCVAQTCFDLMDAGYIVAAAHDAVGSRRAMDREVALKRMTEAGVLAVTVESALMELVHEAGGEKFAAILPIIK